MASYEVRFRETDNPTGRQYIFNVRARNEEQARSKAWDKATAFAAQINAELNPDSAEIATR